MPTILLIRILDVLAVATALLAAALWLRASTARLRRVSRDETFDAADINRVIVAINRSQILNKNAALATAVSAVAIALRFALDLFHDDSSAFGP